MRDETQAVEAVTLSGMRSEMSSPHLLGLPPFGSPEQPVTGELADFERLLAAGVPLAPIAIVPAEAEEGFYRLNNLPQQIADLFTGVQLEDPDEDDIEEIAPQVRELVRNHYLLDEVIDGFYEATASLGARLRLRRPDSVGKVVAAGRPALLAVKRAWAAVWDDPVLLERLRRQGGLAPEAKPLLIHAADAPLTSTEAVARVHQVLATPVEPFGLVDGSVTRLVAVS